MRQLRPYLIIAVVAAVTIAIVFRVAQVKNVVIGNAA